MRLNLCTKSLVSFGWRVRSCSPMSAVVRLFLTHSTMKYTVVEGLAISRNLAAIICARMCSCLGRIRIRSVRASKWHCSASCLRYRWSLTLVVSGWALSLLRMSCGVGCSSGIRSRLIMSEGMVAMILPMSVCLACMSAFRSCSSSGIGEWLSTCSIASLLYAADRRARSHGP